jgi:hypothetical protein
VQNRRHVFVRYLDNCCFRHPRYVCFRITVRKIFVERTLIFLDSCTGPNVAGNEHCLNRNLVTRRSPCGTPNIVHAVPRNESSVVLYCNNLIYKDVLLSFILPFLSLLPRCIFIVIYSKKTLCASCFSHYNYFISSFSPLLHMQCKCMGLISKHKFLQFTVYFILLRCTYFP